MRKAITYYFSPRAERRSIALRAWRQANRTVPRRSRTGWRDYWRSLVEVPHG